MNQPPKQSDLDMYAERLLNSISTRSSNMFELLNIVHTNNTTDIVKNLFDGLSESQQQKITEQLSNILSETSSSNDSSNFLAKENIIYYMGRFGGQNSRATIKKVYAEETNDHHKFNLAFSACLLGDEAVELDFISKVVPGNKWDQLLRSWTLAFFQNIDNPYDFIDDGTSDWSAAKNPRIKRLSISDPKAKGYHKAMLFRLFDLTILRLFCKSRSFNDLTPPELKVIEQCASTSPGISIAKSEKIEHVKRQLLSGE
ncbi:MAG: hypothetical protein LBG75_03300 [Candidatus Nomurabacteria bacterium]|jgi:hypothetical protein|nr:hypothetical protein [Candidatus Nomurabacteria bacterium]